MDEIKGPFNNFCVEEAYNWHDDIMEITRRIVHETDEARLNNIAEHFEVDLSEIREFIETKNKKQKRMKCSFCGGTLSEIRYHNGKAYRHCFGCHFDRDIEGNQINESSS